MRLSKDGIIYRKEDIDQASFRGVNNEFGHKGQNYSLFKFKGGIYCRHKWVRVLYRMKATTEPSENLDDYKRTREIPAKYDIKPAGTRESEIAPINMPDEGAYK